MATVDNLLKVLDTSFRIFRIGSAVNDIHTTVTDDSLTTSQKVFRVVTDGGVIVGESASIGVTFTKDVKPNVKFGVKAFTNISDVAAEGSKLYCKKEIETSDIANFVLVLSARSLDTMEAATQTSKFESIIKDKKKIEKIQKGCALLKRGVEFAHIAPKTYDAVNSIYDKINNPKAQQKPAANQANVQQQNNEEEDELRYVQQLNEVLNINDINDLIRIPEILEDACAAFPRCPITRRPIRLLVEAHAEEPFPQPLFYERRAINAYLDQHPNQPPIGWPANIPYRYPDLIHPRQRQHEMDAFLRNLVNELKRAHNLNEI